MHLKISLLFLLLLMTACSQKESTTSPVTGNSITSQNQTEEAPIVSQTEQEILDSKDLSIQLTKLDMPVYCDPEITSLDTCNDYIKKFLRVYNALEVKLFNVKEIYLSDTFKKINTIGYVYLDLEESDEMIKEFILEQESSVSLENQVPNEEASKSGFKKERIERLGINILCETAEFTVEKCDKYFEKIKEILEDFDQEFNRIKVIILAEDSEKTNNQGVIILNMKRRSWLIRRYIKKNDK